MHYTIYIYILHPSSVQLSAKEYLNYHVSVLYPAYIRIYNTFISYGSGTTLTNVICLLLRQSVKIFDNQPKHCELPATTSNNQPKYHKQTVISSNNQPLHCQQTVGISDSQLLFSQQTVGTSDNQPLLSQQTVGTSDSQPLLSQPTVGTSDSQPLSIRLSGGTSDSRFRCCTPTKNYFVLPKILFHP
jgi:hypothetical protein